MITQITIQKKSAPSADLRACPKVYRKNKTSASRSRFYLPLLPWNKASDHFIFAFTFYDFSYKFLSAVDVAIFNAKFLCSVRIDKGGKEGSAGWSDEAHGNCVQNSLPQILVITQITIRKNLLNLLICENLPESVSATVYRVVSRRSWWLRR